MQSMQLSQITQLCLTGRNAAGFSLRQHNEKSGYDGCNQYEGQWNPHVAIPQPSVFLKSQRILRRLFERRIWNIKQYSDTVQTGTIEYEQNKTCLKWKNFYNQKCKKNHSCLELSTVVLKGTKYFNFPYQHQLTTFWSNSSNGGSKICLWLKNFHVMETCHQRKQLVPLTDGHVMSNYIYKLKI